jgi:hypothetical protein
MRSYLIVRGGGVRSWQQRFVVLRASKGELRFYENEAAAKANAEAEVVNVGVFEVNLPEATGKERAPFTLVSRSSGTTYYLVAETEELRHRWVSTLQSAIESRTRVENERRNTLLRAFILAEDFDEKLLQLFRDADERAEKGEKGTDRVEEKKRSIQLADDVIVVFEAARESEALLGLLGRFIRADAQATFDPHTFLRGTTPAAR